MGSSRTPKYRVKANFVNFSTRTLQTAVFCWEGRPTLNRLINWRSEMNRSMVPGGTNEHLRGGQSDYGKVWIERNVPGGETVVEYQPPMFEVVS